MIRANDAMEKLCRALQARRAHFIFFGQSFPIS
jgi:hypothetical protein